MEQHVTNGEKSHPLMRKLHPVVELTPVTRPRLLLAAPVAGVGPILLGLLYHKEKQAFQSRLRFQLPGQREFLRRTKWRQFSDPHAFDQRREKVLRDFTDMVAKVGGGVITSVEFPPNASDRQILQILLASAVPDLLA